jgi:hypothetical protein
VNLRTSFVFRQENYAEGVAAVSLYEYDATILRRALTDADRANCA